MKCSISDRSYLFFYEKDFNHATLSAGSTSSATVFTTASTNSAAATHEFLCPDSTGSGWLANANAAAAYVYAHAWPADARLARWPNAAAERVAQEALDHPRNHPRRHYRDQRDFQCSEWRLWHKQRAADSGRDPA